MVERKDTYDQESQYGGHPYSLRMLPNTIFDIWLS